MNTKTSLIGTAVAACLISGAAQATLIDRGGGLIYDADRDITWLADANYAKSSGYDTDGRMTWQNALNWTANLSYYDSVRKVTYDDWRLPKVVRLDDACIGTVGIIYGIGCTGSDLGHLFFTELGGIPGTAISDFHNANFGLFQNVQNVYWEFSPSDTKGFFYMSGSHNYGGGDNLEFYIWAIRNGDVATVPEPETYAMMLVGLGLVGSVARGRRQCEA